MEILFTSRNPIDTLGDHNRYHLEAELGKITQVHQCGRDWEDKWKTGKETLQQYCDDRDLAPDWVMGTPRVKGAKNFGRVVDMHRRPYQQIAEINKLKYDLIILKYPRCPVAHVGEHSAPLSPVPPRLWYDTLTAATAILPQSTEPSTFYPKDGSQDFMFDVAFMGDVGKHTYPLRSVFYKKLPKLALRRGFRLLRHRRMPGKHSQITMSSVLEKNPTIYDNHLCGPVYAKALRLSKTFIFGSSVYRYPLKRWMEAGASKVCILADAPDTAEELGMVPWKTFVPIDKENWKDNLLWALDNPSERIKISKTWHKHVLEHHTSEHRAREYHQILEENL